MSDRGAPVNGRLRQIRDRHFDCYADLAQVAEESGRELDWAGLFDDELANIRGALEWGLATSRPETARFATSLLWYWRSRRFYVEGRQILDRVLRDRTLGPHDRTDTLLAAATLAADHGDAAAARDHYQAAHQLAVSEGDERRRARAAKGLGWSHFKLLQIGAAVQAFTEARALAAGLSLADQADVLRGLGWARGYNDGPEISLELHREARALLEEARDPALLSHYLVETNLLVGCGRVEEALAIADKSIEFSRAAGRPLSYAWAAKSNAAEASGDRELLRRVLDEGIQVARSEESPTVEAKLLARLANHTMAGGEVDSAREAMDGALRLLDGMGALDATSAGFRAELLVLRARLADDEGELDLALELYRQAIAFFARASAHSHAEALVGLARFHLEHGDVDAAREVERQAVSLLDRIDDQVGALVRIDFDLLLGEVDQAIRRIAEALEVAPSRMPRDLPALLWRKAAVLADVGRLEEAVATADELVATGLGGRTAWLSRARLHIASGNAGAGRSDLSQVAPVARLGWASHQLQLATTTACLALLEDRGERAAALWSAVQDYRTTSGRIAPRLSRRFEEPLRQLILEAPSRAVGSRAALDVLRAQVSEEFRWLGERTGA